jgi:hypothetical protein
VSGFPTQLSWRRFVYLLRDLGYRPLESHRGSVRRFFLTPPAAQTWSHSTSLIRETRWTKQLCTTLFASCSSVRMNLFSCLRDVEQKRPWRKSMGNTLLDGRDLLGTRTSKESLVPSTPDRGTS